MNVLFIDIETSPNLGLFWTPGRKISIGYENILQERRIVCICYKWLGKKTVHSFDWGKKQCDKKLLQDFTKVINEADIVVAQNGDRFDLKWITGRLLFHGLPPLKEVRSRDTLKQSRAAFNLNSYRLDYLGEYTGQGNKLKTDYGLWKKVFLGDEKSLEKMIRYCKQDVRLLEKVYNRIQPYVKQTLHMGIVKHGDEMACKSCGSLRTHFDGDRVANKIIYRCRRCNECGAFWRTNIRSET